MGTWLLIFLISGALFYYMYQRHKKLVDSGKIIDRERSFVEKAEDFIISPEAPDDVQKQIESYLPFTEQLLILFSNYCGVPQYYLILLGTHYLA